MTIKFSTLVASVSLLAFCSVSAAAFADGMPFEKRAKPKPILTPIEKPQAEEAASELPPPLKEEPAPPLIAEAPAPEPAAVPESRILDVQPNTSFFGLSIGMYDPFTHRDTSTAFNVEWQPGVRVMGNLQPLFGAMATTEGTLLGYAGLGVPYNITERVFVMPSLSLGVYKPGNGYDLNRNIVGMPGIELAYQFDDKSRLGLRFDVLMNGRSLQARDRTEMVALTYTMPLSSLYGKSSDAPEVPQAMAVPVSAPVAEPVAVSAPAADPAPIPVSAPPAALAPEAAPVVQPATEEPATHHEFP